MADDAAVAVILAEFPEQGAALGIDSVLVASLLDSGLSTSRVYLAAWRAFAGKVTALVDVTESGSSRQNSVLFDRAKQMIDYWQARIDVEDKAAGTPREHGASHTAVRV